MLHVSSTSFEKRGLQVETEVTVPVFYDGVRLDVGLRIDVLVEGKVIIEAKAVGKISRFMTRSS
jgi:GxxExxY protein